MRAFHLVLLTALFTSAAFAQNLLEPVSDRAPQVGLSKTGFLSRLAGPYEVRDVTQVNFQNSSRIFDLMRAGQLYLSLEDAIALALEKLPSNAPREQFWTMITFPLTKPIAAARPDRVACLHRSRAVRPPPLAYLRQRTVPRVRRRSCPMRNPRLSDSAVRTLVRDLRLQCDSAKSAA